MLDAVASLGRAGAAESSTTSVISRDLDLLKSRGITTVMTTLTHQDSLETSQVDMSSLIDTWLLLRNHESNGERNRLLFVIKSRGSAHSNQVREFVLTDHGAELLDVYVGPNGVLTGSARIEQVAQERQRSDARSTSRSAVGSELAPPDGGGRGADRCSAGPAGRRDRGVRALRRGRRERRAGTSDLAVRESMAAAARATRAATDEAEPACPTEIDDDGRP